MMAYPASLGALSQLYAGTSDEGKNLNGEVRCNSVSQWLVANCMQYLIPWARVGKCSSATESPEVAAQLWSWLEKEIETWEAKQAMVI